MIIDDIRRGDIFWIENENAVGAEQSGKRPAVVVSNDIGNQNTKCPIVEIVYLTTAKKKPLPTHVDIREGTVICEQISTIDKSRLCGYVRSLGEREMLQVNRAMMVSLGMIL